MSTEQIAKLTPKQRQVHDLLVKGTPPAEIAKKLKISPSGVYGHKRNIEQALGAPIPIPDGVAPAKEPAPAFRPNAGSTGTSFTLTELPHPARADDDPARVLQAAIERANTRAAEIDQAVQELTREREVIAERLMKYTAAAEALA